MTQSIASEDSLVEAPIITILQASSRVGLVASVFRDTIRDVAKYLIHGRIIAAQSVWEDGNASSVVVDIETTQGYAHLVVTAQFWEDATTPVRIWLYEPQDRDFTLTEFPSVADVINQLEASGALVGRHPLM